MTGNVWKRMTRTPWSATQFPTTDEGKARVQTAVRHLNRVSKDLEFRWTEWLHTDHEWYYIIQVRRQ